MTKKQLFLGSVIFISAFLSYIISGQDGILVIAAFLIGSYGTSFEKSAKSILWGQISSVVIISSLSLIGVIDNVKRVSDRGVRYSMGFNHPNMFSIIILQIIAIIIYISFKRLNGRHFLMFLITTIVTYFITYSRTGLLVSVFLISVTYLYKFFEKVGMGKIWGKIVRNTTKIIVLISILGSIYLATNYNKLLASIPKQYYSLFQRFRLLNAALELYPVKIFGQYVKIASSTDYFANRVYLNGGAVIDNSYVYLLLQFGIINTIWILLGYYNVIKKSGKSKNWPFLICLFSLLIMGFVEKYFVNLNYNFTFLMLGSWLFENKKSEVNMEEE